MSADVYTLIADVDGLIESIQPDSVVSRTFYKDDQLRAIVFGFDSGQELSEHTSSQTAMIHIVKGDATVTLGDDSHELSAGRMGTYATAPQTQHPRQNTAYYAFSHGRN